MKLLSESELESSCIVANNRMNRERVALGSNGYETDLGFDPIAYLTEQLERHGSVAWLDLCCGRGKAVIQAGETFLEQGITANVSFVGVDLVGMFDPIPDDLDFVTLIEASLSGWNTAQAFDLVTCVHGLHYIGDKVGLIKRATSKLQPHGKFVANLDPNNLRMLDSNAHSDVPVETEFDFLDAFREYGFRFDGDLNLLEMAAGDRPLDSSGLASPDLDSGNCKSHIGSFSRLEFAGADDTAGPNYTGQEAVDSYYYLSGSDAV